MVGLGWNMHWLTLDSNESSMSYFLLGILDGDFVGANYG